MSTNNKSNRGVIIAFLVAGFALVGASIFANRVRNTPPEKVPVITLDSFTRGPVSNPVSVRFVTDAPLDSAHGMWSAGDLHPHVLVDTVMTMPMASDIERVPGDSFVLHLPNMAVGEHDVRIFWANNAHIAVGDSASVKVLIK